MGRSFTTLHPRMVVRRAGFTILELIIVLFVLSLLAAIMVPNMVSALGARSTTVSADEFTRTHALAKAAAMQHGRLAMLRIDPASGRFWAELPGAGAATADTVGIVHDLSERELTLRSTRTTLCYDARGLAVSPSGCDAPNAVVTFARSGRADTVVITATGRLER